MILDLVGSYSEDVPIFVAGDLNLEPGEKPYRILTSELTDFRTMAAESSMSGGGGGFTQDNQESWLGSDGDEHILTYTGFTDKKKDMLIDYIFVKYNLGVKSPHYSVPSNIKDGKYISDHRSVIVDVQVPHPYEQNQL
jgi:endonuclease/exonuclease/phosphatase family metal-dependent hydrolase